MTGEGSKLNGVAESEGWLARLPMWDWVGGRTSELAAVDFYPQRYKVLGSIEYSPAQRLWMRRLASRKPQKSGCPTRSDVEPDRKGSKDMVVLPYKDRLMLFSKYLQQLVMESLGKEFDLVAPSARDHSLRKQTNRPARYVQQLREGVHNFL